MPPSHIRKVCPRDFFAWCLSFCFAGLAVTAAAQSQPAGASADPNAPVIILPEGAVRPAPSVQARPSPDAWDRWGIQKLPEDDNWARHFRLGALVGLNISANFKMNGPIIPSNPANGMFEDGYVRSDGTGPYTGYWGYNNASQYNAANQQLSMRAVSAYTPTSGNNVKEAGSAFVGFDLAYGGNLWKWGTARIGWDFGFGLLPINITANQTMNALVTRSTYVFNTGGIDMPTAPYQGTRGGLGGPIIPVQPASVTPDATSTPETITGSHTLDVTLYTFRLGPSLFWDLNENFGLSAGAGPAVGIVNGNYNYNETILAGGVSTPNQGQIDATDVVYGGYVNATLTYHLVQNGDLFVGVQYMSLGNATISGGGREGQLNLNGQVYISAGINWPF
jgi:hypothetical protein